MGLIDTVKEIASVAQKMDNIALNKHILDLQQEAFKSLDQIRELKEKVSTLEKQLATRAAMKFVEPFYYVEGDRVPHCPKCWESESKAVHLYETTANNSDCHRCLTCGKIYYTRNHKPHKAI